MLGFATNNVSKVNYTLPQRPKISNKPTNIKYYDSLLPLKMEASKQQQIHKFE